MNTARKYEAEQAQQLQAWVEGRKRNRRVQIPPMSYWQESGYEAESDKLEKAMDRVGWTALVIAGLIALVVIYVQCGKYFYG